MRFTRQTVINAGPDKVFAYVSDISRHPEWAAHKLKMEPAATGSVGVGAKFSSVGHQMGMDSRDEVTVTEHSPAQRFSYEARSKEGLFRHVIAFVPAPPSPSTGGATLGRAGYEVVTVEDVDALAQALAAGDTQVVILDLHAGAGAEDVVARAKVVPVLA